MTYTLTDESLVAAEPADVLDADLYRFQEQLSPREQQDLVAVRKFLESDVRPIADEFWERTDTPRHLFPKIADLGILGNAFASTRRFENSCVYRGWVAMEISRVDASTATMIGVHSGLAMTSIEIGGSPEQRAQWLPRLARGELVAAFALTEPEHGSDTAKGLETTAQRRVGPSGDDEWVLRGAKRWIGNGAFADLLVVWARDLADDQVKGFLVQTPTPGFTATKIERKQSLRSVENADIVLDGVVVPEAMRLQNVHSFREVAHILKLIRANVSWQALGVSVGAYDAAVRYTRERQQFGRPIAAYQLVQQKLSDMLGKITASFAMCVRVSQLQDEDALSDHQAAMAKAYVTQCTRDTVALARAVCGGNGIQLDYGVARFFGDAEAIYTFDGTYDMNSLIVGRAITGIPAFV